MPWAWRLVKTKYLANAWDGEGARLHGGRWNSPGVRAVYTSESLALAVLEGLVHTQVSALLPAYSAIRVDFDEALVETLNRAALPQNWRDYPAPREVRVIGDTWVADRRSAILCVPSAIIPTESNYLMNPEHPDFKSMTIAPAAPFGFISR